MDRVVRRDLLIAFGALLTLLFVAKAQQLGNVRRIWTLPAAMHVAPARH